MSRIAIAVAALACVAAAIWFWNRKSQPQAPAGPPIASVVAEFRGGDYYVVLSKLQSRSDEAVPALMAALGDPDPKLRAAAARALGDFVPAATSALPALEKLMADDDRNVRDAAALALSVLDRKPDRLRGVLERDDDDDVRERAFAALVGCRFDGSFGPILRKGLDDRQPTVRRAAAAGLAILGADGKDAAPRLRELLADPDPRVRVEAAFALFRATGESNDSIRVLDAADDDQNPAVRRAAAAHKREILNDPRFGPAAPTIRK